MSFEYPVYSNQKPEDAPYARQIDAEGDGKDLYLELPKGNEQEINEFPTWPTTSIHNTEKIDIAMTPQVSTRRDIITGLAVGGIITIATGIGAKNKISKSADNENEHSVREPWYQEINYGDTASSIVIANYGAEDLAKIEDILANYTSVIRKDGSEDHNIDELYVGDVLKITYPKPEVTPEP